MWRPLSLILEIFTHLRYRSRFERLVPAIGTLGAVDVRGGDTWTRYATPRSLFELWAPAFDSPYEPYHCVTLFAALGHARTKPHPPPPGVVERIEDRPLIKVPDQPIEVHWLNQSTMVIIDIFGPAAVSLGVRFIQRGCQPVCTFDNWPHPRGVGKPEFTLAALLYYSPLVADARELIKVDSPPVWLCDASRLVGRRPSPGNFDNRYYLDDTLLPGSNFLKAQGIDRLVIILGNKSRKLAPDVEAWLADRARDGFEVFSTHLDEPALDVQPIRPVRGHFPRIGSRSAAGGFGSLVPEPSSSGG
ncbi:MAG: hypothetical protein EA397_02750 [Deltaproteobacteria bacterium]|nr:MAG: hypothetical protein EA397_02750 [Deltaproteobacteria bacterium]